MRITAITHNFSVGDQLSPDDLDTVRQAGFRTIINNRPDSEEAGQPASADLAARAAALGLRYRELPVKSGVQSPAAAATLSQILAAEPGPALAFCRTGARARALFEAALTRSGDQQAAVDVLIVGGGAAGIAVAASLLRRRGELSIAIVEPRDEHYYQPGWTMVGGGIFAADETRRDEDAVIPVGAQRIKGAVTAFLPDRKMVLLDDGRQIGYRALIVAAGIALDWAAIAGLEQSLGKNGVTSNYRYDTAPYTWKLVRETAGGTALFTQPPMPIKCAGAPQKAMYLSCDHWRRSGRLGNIDVAFHNAGPALFGVADYVPALMEYIERYGIDLRFGSRLVAVDGTSREATFEDKNGQVTRRFDMIHVCPPQRAPRFIADSPLADGAGYLAVDPATLRHPVFPDVFALGDCAGTTNAKTAAAARKQAPVAAVNVLATLDDRPLPATYDGYGSCPLTVERGRIVLAEFGYGGKLMPSFPRWLIDGQRAQRLPWLLKAKALPWIYWNAMLKGREWLVAPTRTG